MSDVEITTPCARWCTMHDLDDSCAGQAMGYGTDDGLGAINWRIGGRDVIVLEKDGQQLEVTEQEALSLVGHVMRALEERRTAAA